MTSPSYLLDQTYEVYDDDDDDDDEGIEGGDIDDGNIDGDEVQLLPPCPPPCLLTHRSMGFVVGRT